MTKLKIKNPQRLSSQLKVLLETEDKSVNSSGPKLNYTNKTILYISNPIFSGWHGKMSIQYKWENLLCFSYIF